MKLKIYSIKDLAAQAFGRPMYLQSTGVALRTVTDEVNRSDDTNNLYRHPADFELYHHGEFDEDTGKFETHDPVLVTRCVDLVTKSA